MVRGDSRPVVRDRRGNPILVGHVTWYVVLVAERSDAGLIQQMIAISEGAFVRRIEQLDEAVLQGYFSPGRLCMCAYAQYDSEGSPQNIVAGLLLASYSGTEVNIDKLAVAQDHRGRGVGSRLLNELLAFVSLRRKGLQTERVRLMVDVRNGKALRLYARHGFRKDREVRNYYGAGEHGLAMSRAIVIGGAPPPAQSSAGTSAYAR